MFVFCTRLQKKKKVLSEHVRGGVVFNNSARCHSRHSDIGHFAIHYSQVLFVPVCNMAELRGRHGEAIGVILSLPPDTSLVGRFMGVGA